mmetsp:Transcript_37986/g.100466  ORF Transcript_37986/g.100466 Transcript_37986/m.100466 type:complete len:249 (+) Transcript_37986:71-817(+)
MAGTKTIYWRVKEASLSRASFNALVGGPDDHGHNKLDVTEEMMKAAVIGRMSEIEGFEPPGITSRKIAELLATKRPGAGPPPVPVPVVPRARPEAPLGLQPQPATGRSGTSAKVSARLLSYHPTAERPTWSAMMPPSREMSETPSSREIRSPSTLSQAGTGVLARAASGPLHPPSGHEGATATRHWGPKEHALHRDSFNAHVMHRKLDVTEVMMRDAQMSTSAMMGPGWQPAGIVSRQIAGILTKDAA